MQFSDQSTGAAAWDWDFGDGNTNSSQNPLHTFSAAGTYWVCLTIWDAAGCEGWYCDSVTVQTLDTRERDDFPSLIAYPVPAGNHIKIEGTGILQVEAFDLLGTQIEVPVKNQQSHAWEIDSSEWANGIWILQVTTSSGMGRLKLLIAR